MYKNAKVLDKWLEIGKKLANHLSLDVEYCQF